MNYTFVNCKYNNVENDYYRVILEEPDQQEIPELKVGVF